MTKILIIPDVHGRIFWKESCKDISDYEYVIFLGDYVDSYPSENISEEQTYNNFVEIIDFKKNNSDKVILLTGNHDWNYIDYRFIKSSRYKSSMFDKYNQLFTDNKDLFKVVFKYDNYLFSHAGITLGWLKEINLLDYEHLNKEYIDNLISYLSKISFWRCGPDDFGSCVWADIHELCDLDMLPENIYQIFGHTQLKEPIITDKWACLDCRKSIILDNRIFKYWNSDEELPIRTLEECQMLKL